MWNTLRAWRIQLLTGEGLPQWMAPVSTAVRWAWILFRELQRDRAFIRASGMAYVTLIALVPLLLLVFGLLDAFGVLQRNPDVIERLIFDSFVQQIPEVRDVLLPGLVRVDLGAMGLVGVGGLVVVAGRLYAMVERAYNDMFGVENKRKTWMRALIFYAAVTAGPVIFFATSVRMLEWLTGSGWSLGRGIALGSVQFAVLVAALKGFPATKVRWGPALLGSLVSLGLLHAGGWAFQNYLVLFAADDPVRVIYGSLGVLPAFLLWLYLEWVAVLIGVEIAAVTQNFSTMLEAEEEALREDLAHAGAPGLDAALLVAALISERFEHGQAPIASERLAQEVGLHPRDLMPVLGVLQDAAFIVHGDEGWMPSRPPEQVTVAEVAVAWRRASRARADVGPLQRVRSDLDAMLDGTLLDAIVRWRLVPESEADRGEEGPPPHEPTLEGGH